MGSNKIEQKKAHWRAIAVKIPNRMVGIKLETEKIRNPIDIVKAV